MRMAYRLLLVYCLLAHIGYTSCPLSKQQMPKIQTDCLNLYSSSPTPTSYSYTPQLPKHIAPTPTPQPNIYPYKYQQQFNRIPQIALSIKQIHHPYSTLIYFKINTTRITYTSVQFLVDQIQDYLCKKICIGFLATDRQDVEIGVVGVVRPGVGLGVGPGVGDGDSSFSVSYGVRGEMDVGKGNVRYFISGISLQGSSKSSNNGIKHIDTCVESTKIVLKFSITKNSKLQFLHISIIIYSLPQSVYITNQVISSSSLSSTYTSAMVQSSQFSTTKTHIIGIVQFEVSRKQSLSFSLSINEFDIEMAVLGQGQLGYIGVGYVVIEIGQCGDCQGYPYLYQGKCKNKCPSGNPTPTGICTPNKCPTNEHYINNKCQCIQNCYRIDNKCQKCPEGKYYNKTYKTCQSLCSQNSQYRNGRCYCKDGYYLIDNSRCQKCRAGTVYNRDSLRCEMQCGRYQREGEGGCQCVSGYERVNGQCRKCSDNQYYDEQQNRYKCKTGYQKINNKCIKKCSNGQIRVDGICQCPQGEYKINGICTNCGKYSYYSNGKCKCEQNYIFINDKCRLQCPEHMQMEDGKCVTRCNGGYQRYDVEKGCCECVGGYEKVQGVCVEVCGVYQYRDNGVCRCVQGYAKKYTNVCEKSNCPYGTTWDASRSTCISTCSNNQVYRNGKCSCPEGYYRNTLYNTCQKNCSTYQTLRNGACQCIRGYIRNIYGYCTLENSGPKTCLPGMILMFGQCRAQKYCGQFQQWCGTQCKCIAGYYKKNGACRPVQPTLLCPENSVSNGVSCMCLDGYFPVVEGVCEKCPYGTYWDGIYCNTNTHQQQCTQNLHWDKHRKNCYTEHTNCDQNQQWNGIKCTCKQGRFFINGKCKQCERGTVFDGIKCSVGYSMGKCQDPYSIWNGKSCVCLPGYWPLAGGKCVDCPQGTSWDGTCCKQDQRDKGHRYPKIVY